MSVEMKEVFVINQKEGEDKTNWTRIGVAFTNRDKSLNVILDAVPLSGRLHIRERKPTKDGNSKFASRGEPR